MNKKCPICGRFLDMFGACVRSCGYGWLSTDDGFAVHPEDAEYTESVKTRSGVMQEYATGIKRVHKHTVTLW